MSLDGDETKYGTIVNFRAEPSSGVAQLVVKTDEGKLLTIPCENGPTVRGLMNALGPDIVAGHSVLVNRLQGRRIGFDVDDVGILAYITEAD